MKHKQYRALVGKPITPEGEEKPRFRTAEEVVAACGIEDKDLAALASMATKDHKNAKEMLARCNAETGSALRRIIEIDVARYEAIQSLATKRREELKQK